MVQYARCDAHYLLYIADCLASELKDKTHDSSDDKYNEAFRRSNMVSLQLYVKKVQSSLGMTFNSNCEIKERISKFCAWRDLMARIHDDSSNYVLSDNAMVALAAKLPKEPMDVYDVIADADSSHESSSIKSVLPSPSPVVNFHVNELCCLLQETDANLSDEFFKYLKKHLCPTGCCPLSLYNYTFSSEFSLKGKGTLFINQSREKFTSPGGTKTSHQIFDQKLCKSPDYQSCRIYTSDGQLLCLCDRKRMQWYLRHERAKLVENDPQAIMLLFEPKGRTGIRGMKNICVGCGEKNLTARYRVIPSCYRVHFPRQLKDQLSADAVLLCASCQGIANSAADKYKEQIAKEFNIPLLVRKVLDRGGDEFIAMTTKSISPVEKGVSPSKLKSAAGALLRHGSSMPLEKRDELVQIVREYFGGREISSEDLEGALLVGLSPHARRKVEKSRGLYFKHSEWSAIPKSTCPDTTESGANVIAKLNESSRYNSENVLSGVALSSTEQQYHTRIGLERESAFTSNILNGIVDQSDGTCGSSLFLPKQVSSKHKKLSVFGDGPHGKQVVEHLLHTHGEDGIKQFCQRWRQVFVKAVHPHFLPSDWDVMSS